MELPRRKNPVGWDDTAFQFWDRMNVWQPLGLPCVPLLGRYGPDYMPAVPFVVIKLPPSVAEEAFPAEVRQILTDTGGTNDAPVFVILVHPALPGSDKQNGVDEEANVMVHPWALPHIEEMESMQAARPEVGVFPVAGVAPVRMRTGTERAPMVSRAEAAFNEDLLGGVAFGELRSSYIFVHDSSFSPNNLRLRVSCDESPLSAFFSVAKMGHRSISAFHILPADEATEDALRSKVASSPDVSALRAALVEAFTKLEAVKVSDWLATVLDALCSSPSASQYVAGLVE